MAKQQFSIGDKFYRVTGGGLDRHYHIDIDEVKSVTQTSTGYTYNDRISPYYMYTDLGTAKKRAKSLISEWTETANKIVDEYNKSLDGF